MPDADLCGAWALDGGPVEKLLSEKDRQAMLGQAPAHPQARAETLSGPLWLNAGSDAFLEVDGAVIAFSGSLFFPTGGPQSLGALLAKLSEGPAEAPAKGFPGYYAMVYAEPAAGTLVLSCGPAAGQPLWFGRVGDLLLFSSCLRCLLAHHRMPRKAHRDAAWESVLGGGVTFGRQSLASGIEAVPFGQTLGLEQGSRDLAPLDDVGRQALAEPGEEPSPTRILDGLREASRLALGSDQQAAVLVSGGVDSAAVLGLAVELLGAKNLAAFTYEVPDGTQLPETELARRTCVHYGVPHEVVRIELPDFIDAAPEFLWRMEDFTPILHGLPIVLLARRARERGFTKILSGLGLDTLFGEPYLRDLDDLGRLLDIAPNPGLVPVSWLSAFCRKPAVQSLLALAHPGLRMPTIRLWHFLLCVLKHHQVIPSVADFYPEDMRARVAELAESPRVRDAVAETSDLPLPVQLQRFAQTFLYSFHSAHRAAKVLRQTGIHLEMPSMILKDLMPTPYAAGRAPQQRQMRKSGFSEKLRGFLPDDIRVRRKFVQGSLFDGWYDQLHAAFAPTALDSLKRLDFELEAHQGTLFFHQGRYYSRFHMFLVPTALWHRAFMEGPLAAEPPTWETWRKA